MTVRVYACGRLLVRSLYIYIPTNASIILILTVEYIITIQCSCGGGGEGEEWRLPTFLPIELREQQKSRMHILVEMSPAHSCILYESRKGTQLPQYLDCEYVNIHHCIYEELQ